MMTPFLLMAVAFIDVPWTLQAPRTEVREHVSGVYWIEAENFADYGEWLLDTQFAHRMGSGYLLAPGVGKPVAAAETKITVGTAGRYRVLVRTKDWVPAHHPGRFALEIAEFRRKCADHGVTPYGVGPITMYTADEAKKYFDYDGIFAALKEIGYDGCLGLELANAFPKNPEWIDESREYFEGLIG